tara:strand:+ start:851 stop:1309 length:459 start_codon:yes stop_codon:yes gene_type:complete
MGITHHHGATKKEAMMNAGIPVPEPRVHEESDEKGDDADLDNRGISINSKIGGYMLEEIYLRKASVREASVNAVARFNAEMQKEIAPYVVPTKKKVAIHLTTTTDDYHPPTQVTGFGTLTRVTSTSPEVIALTGKKVSSSMEKRPTKRQRTA